LIDVDLSREDAKVLVERGFSSGPQKRELLRGWESMRTWSGRRRKLVKRVRGEPALSCFKPGSKRDSVIVRERFDRDPDLLPKLLVLRATSGGVKDVEDEDEEIAYGCD